MEDLKVAFGQRLSALRAHARLTQEKLAELAETSRDTIRNIEKGRHMPRFQLLARLSAALDAHPRDFFDFDWPADCNSSRNCQPGSVVSPMQAGNDCTKTSGWG